MKKILTLLLVVATLLQTVQAAEKTLTTKINEVVVYLEGAQVTRIGQMQLPAGNSEIVIKNLTPLIDKQSLQVTGDGAFSILSVNFQLNYVEQKKPMEEIGKLVNRLKELDLKVKENNNKVSVLQAELELLTNNRSLGGAQNGVDVAQLKAAYLFTKEVMPGIKSEITTLTEQSLKFDEERKAIQQQLNIYKVANTSASGEIVIKVSAKAATNASFKIGYVVSAARWYPSYELRVENVEKPLALVYKANVSQQTGEDWNDVKLTLSTTNPNKSTQKPELQPWLLRFNQQVQKPATNAYGYNTGQFGSVRGRITDQYGEPIAYALITIPGTTIGTAADIDGFYSLTLPPTARQMTVSFIGYQTVTVNISQVEQNIALQEASMQLEEVMIVKEKKVRNAPVPTAYAVAEPSYSLSHTSSNIELATDMVSGVSSQTFFWNNEVKKQKRLGASQTVPIIVEQQVNIVDVDFKIKDLYSIPSDAKHYNVEINNIEMPAHYQYYCAPKLDKDVFLTAKITDWEQYNLLEGQANVFYEGTYVGTSVMNVKFVEDTLDISLGRDRNIVVERTKLRDFSKRKMIGSDKVDARKWEIKVRNNKAQEIDLIVEDQYPISSDGRIVVEQEGHSGGALNTVTGIVTWKMKLKKSDSKTVEIKYNVRYPENTVIYLE